MDQDVDPAAVVGDDGARGERGRRRRRRGRRRPPTAPLFSPPVVTAAAASNAFTPTICSSSCSPNLLGSTPDLLLLGGRAQRVAGRQLLRSHALVPDADEAEAQEREPGAAAAQEGDDARAALLVAEEERGEAAGEFGFCFFWFWSEEGCG